MLSFVRRPDICGLRLLAVFRPQALGAEVYLGEQGGGVGRILENLGGNSDS